jgi:iron complex outermembrane receptor protein
LIEFDGLGTPVPLEIDHDLSVASIEGLIKPLPKHAGRLQLEYRDTRSKFASSGTPTGSGGADIYSIGGTWHWQTTDWLSMIAAGRLDHYAMFSNSEPRGFSVEDYDHTLTEPSYNLGSVAKVSANDSVRLAFGRGVLLPNHIDLFYSVPIPANAFGLTRVSGDPRIDPTKNLNAELGWNHRFETIDANFDASVFWQKLSDVKSVSPRFSDLNLVVVGSEVINLPRNVGDTTIVGSELALEGKLTEDWSYRLGYTLLSVDDDFEVNQTALAYAVDFEDSTPTHTVDIGLGYGNGPFEGDLAFRWQSKRTFLTPNNGPATFNMITKDVDNVVDLTGRLGYRMTDQVDLPLIGTNILGGTDWGPGVDIDSRILLSLRIAFD